MGCSQLQEHSGFLVLARSLPALPAPALPLLVTFKEFLIISWWVKRLTVTQLVSTG